MTGMARSYRTSIGAFAVLLLVSLSAWAGRQSSTMLDSGVDKKKARMIEKIKRSPSVATRVADSEAPLVVRESNSKEIRNSDYHELVGRTTPSERVSSFPEVKLFNGSDKRVTAFTLLLEKVGTSNLYFIKSAKISILPREDYVVSSFRWIQWQRSDQPPDFDSAEIWLIGGADEFIVRVGMVQFEDGSKWEIGDVEAPRKSDARISRVGFEGPMTSRLQPLRYTPRSCVCSCGATCHDGSYDCTGHGESCSYGEAVGCINGCCAAAAKAEGCGDPLITMLHKWHFTTLLE